MKTWRKTGQVIHKWPRHRGLLFIYSHGNVREHRCTSRQKNTGVKVSDTLMWRIETYGLFRSQILKKICLTLFPNQSIVTRDTWSVQLVTNKGHPVQSCGYNQGQVICFTFDPGMVMLSQVEESKEDPVWNVLEVRYTWGTHTSSCLKMLLDSHQSLKPLKVLKKLIVGNLCLPFTSLL